MESKYFRIARREYTSLIIFNSINSASLMNLSTASLISREKDDIKPVSHSVTNHYVSLAD